LKLVNPRFQRVGWVPNSFATLLAASPLSRAKRTASTLNSRVYRLRVLRIRHVPVVADGRLTGIISIGDVVKNRIGELEFERDQLDSYVHQT